MQPNERSYEAFSAYVENQAADYIDLTTNLTDPNDSVKALASALYSKPFDSLEHNLTGILIENMQTVDIFSMLLDLVLYGTVMLPEADPSSSVTRELGIIRSSISLISPDQSITNPLLLERIQCYIKSAGLHMTFECSMCNPLEAYTYREQSKLFCEILPKPPLHLFNPNCWSVGSYCIHENPQAIYSNLTPLSSFKAYAFSPDCTSVTIISFQQTQTQAHS